MITIKDNVGVTTLHLPHISVKEYVPVGIVQDTIDEVYYNIFNFNNTYLTNDLWENIYTDIMNRLNDIENIIEQ